MLTVQEFLWISPKQSRPVYDSTEVSLSTPFLSKRYHFVAGFDILIALLNV